MVNDPRFNKNSPMKGSLGKSTSSVKSKKTVKRKPKIGERPLDIEGKETILTVRKKLTKTGREKTVYRWVHIRQENIKKRYGTLPRRTDTGERIYARKISVKDTITGKIKKKAIVNTTKYINVGKYWAPYVPGEIIQVKVITTRGKETKLETMEKLKYGYKKSRGGFQRKRGPISRPAQLSKNFDDKPEPGMQVKATVTYVFVEGKLKGKIITNSGYSFSQTKRRIFTQGEMEDQAIANSLANICSEYGVSYEAAKAAKQNEEFDIGKLL